MEHSLGTAFEAMVGENLLIAGRKEKQLTSEQQNYHNGVPAITVAVDAGWSKHSHKYSYNANSGFGMTFGAATKALFCSLASQITIAQYVPLVPETMSQLHQTSAFLIGQVAPAAWKLILF